MTLIWTVGQLGDLVDVEGRHLVRWREIADASRAWMDFHYFVHESPAESRQRRHQDYCADWTTVVTRAGPSPESGYGMSLDLALETATGELLSTSGELHNTLASSSTSAIIRWTLPRILEPAEVDRLLAALRTHRDRAMVEAMVLGGCAAARFWGCGSRISTWPPGECSSPTARVAISAGCRCQAGSSPRWLTTWSGNGRPRRAPTGSSSCPRAGGGAGCSHPRASDQVLRDACRRAGLRRLTCHQLRHTCLTRLREAGMALEAVQAQAGHRSIESSRIYLHLADAWLASEYQRAIETLDAEEAGPDQTLR